MPEGLKNDQVAYCRQLLAGGASATDMIRLLRERFSLSLIEAKEIWTLAVKGISLDEHQERLADALEELFERGA